MPGHRIVAAAGTVAASTTVAGAAAGTEVLPGLYAAGEASGFGGGGVHGHNALEGTFLGGCLFSGRQAARGILEDLR